MKYKWMFLLQTIVSVSIYSAAAHAEQPRSITSLNSEEAEILRKGPISDDRRIGGAVLGATLGFGLGHSVVGQYRKIGWVFTIGEAAAVGVIAYGTVNTMFAGMPCENCSAESERERKRENDSYQPYVIGGLIGLAALKVWETTDVIIRPNIYNARYREVKAKADRSVSLSAAPIVTPDGAGAMIQMKF